MVHDNVRNLFATINNGNALVATEVTFVDWPETGFGEIATQAVFGDAEYHSTTFRRHSLTAAEFNSAQRRGWGRAQNL